MPIQTNDIKYDPHAKATENFITVDNVRLGDVDEPLVWESVYGCFYIKDLVVKDANDAVLMTQADFEKEDQGIDTNQHRFEVIVDTELTARAGMMVGCGILLKDAANKGVFKVTARYLGGVEGKTQSMARHLLDVMSKYDFKNGYQVPWDNINHPKLFPPEKHNHPITQITEYQLLTDQLKELTQALVNTSNLGSNAKDVYQQLSFVRTLIEELSDRVNLVETEYSQSNGVYFSTIITELNELKRVLGNAFDVSGYQQLLSDNGMASVSSIVNVLVPDL